MKRFAKRLLTLLLLVAPTIVLPGEYGSPAAIAQNKVSSTKKKTNSKANSKSTSKSKVPNSQAKPKKTNSTNSRRTLNQKSSASPKSSAEAKRMQEAAQRDIQKTKEQLRLNEEQIKTSLSDLNRLSAEITDGRKQVDGLRKKVDVLDKEINQLGAQIEKNEEQLKLMRDEYLKAVKKMRLTKKNQSTLAFVFASDNFNQAMRRVRYMRQFSDWKSRKSADIDKKIKALDNERSRLSDAKEDHTVALSQLSKTQSELEANHRKQEALVVTLRHNGDALQTHLVAKQKEANRLKETISSLIAQEQAKAEAERRAREKAEAERIAKEKAEAERIAREKAEAERKAEAEKKGAVEPEQKKADKKKPKEEKKDVKNSEKGSRKKNKKEKTAPAPAPVAKPKVEEKKPENYSGINFAELRGKLPRPVEGAWRITNPFGRHAMPELPEVEYDNPGIDAEVAKGATVKAVCKGKVSGVYKVDGYGTVVIVNHGDYYTVYGNLAGANVSVGTSVNGGQSLGSAGADPDDDRHGSVHFEVWKGREKQNPASWLR